MKRKVIFGLAIVVMLVAALVPSVSAAPGDLLWAVNYNPSTSDDQASAVAVYKGCVYVVGYDYMRGWSDAEWRIQKRNATNGKAVIWSRISNPTAYEDKATGVAVDSTGIYVVGYQNYYSGGGESVSLDVGDAGWRIEKRSLLTGNVIWAVTSNPSNRSEEPFDVAVDRTGVYIVGYDGKLGVNNAEWRIEKRSLATGSLIWSRTSKPTAYCAYANGVAVDSTGVYVVGSENTASSWTQQRWRIEKRNPLTGGLVRAVTRDFSSGPDVAMDVAVDSTGIYIVGVDFMQGTNYEWRIEKRSKTSFYPMLSLSTIWSKVYNPSAGNDIPYSVAVDSTGVYIVGDDRIPGTMEWRIQKRSLTTGNVIWSRSSNPTAYHEGATGVAVDGTGVYVVGWIYPGGVTAWRIEKRIR